MKNSLLGRLWNGLAFAFIRLVVWKFKPPIFLGLNGGPGTGKGTQADKLAPATRRRKVSTGDLFRIEIANQTPLGKQVEQTVKSGGIVADEISFGLLARELAQPKYWRGAILDGYPRTIGQARLLEQLFAKWGCKMNIVFLLEVPRKDIVERLSGRRVCSNKSCGKSYHVTFSPPKTPDVCDVCSSKLFRRDDDAPEVVENRLIKYEQESAPIIEFYESCGTLKRIATTNKDGADAVLEKILAHLRS
jgi:adenylate kinases